MILMDPNDAITTRLDMMPKGGGLAICDEVEMGNPLCDLRAITEKRVVSEQAWQRPWATATTIWFQLRKSRTLPIWTRPRDLAGWKHHGLDGV